MSQAPVAAGGDRLPWLADEPAPALERGNVRGLVPFVVAAAMLLLGTVAWIGAHRQPAPLPAASPGPSNTVTLPRPREAAPRQPQVVLEAPPEVHPSPQRELALSRPPVERHLARRIERIEAAPSNAGGSKPAVASAPAAPSASPATGASVATRPLPLWPASQSAGAYGRIVRIGAFGSRVQPKLGWRYMVGAYPAVAHLPATVVESRNSHGRSFYRFQIGTTSQAHSEVLCQRMEKIHLSCAVVGLPWKPKGVER